MSTGLGVKRAVLSFATSESIPYLLHSGLRLLKNTETIIKPKIVVKASTEEMRTRNVPSLGST
jgi:hypothetical protein